MVLGDPSNKDALKDQMSHMVENLKNPYEEMYHWIKGEMYDIQALCKAIESRDNLENSIRKLEKKKTNT